MSDATTLPAGRELDCEVARALGWKVIGDNLGLDYYIVDCNGLARAIPYYSTTDAALEALEEFQNKTGFAVGFSHNPGGAWRCWSESDRPPSCDHAYPWVDGTTLLLAICRLIVSTLGKEKT